MTIERKEEIREKKYGTKSLKEFSKIKPFFVYPVWHKTGKTGRRLVKTIIKDFFLLQELEQFHIYKIPVINVETELDGQIPFVPEKISDYMTFIDLIINSLDFFKKRLGYKESADLANEYMTFVTKLYKNASSIYRFSMTTTNRPKYYKGKFITVHLFDPHLLCVPSLHVSAASGIYFWFLKNIDRMQLSETEKKQRLSELKTWAIEIIESVLFVKQHSVKCIPAAFYMISVTNGENFISPSEAVNLINELFKDSDLISAENKKAVTDHFQYIYERFLLENNYCERWQEPVEKFLSNFQSSN